MRHKVFLITLNKAGTYYVSEILKHLGFNATLLHIQTTHYTAYDKNRLEEGRFHPERFKHEKPISYSAGLIPEGGFAVGHLLPLDETKNVLTDFKKIYLVRNIRNCLVSYMRFLRDTGRQYAETQPWFHMEDPKRQFSGFLQTLGESLIFHWAGQQKWRDDPQVFCTSYENLLGITETAIAEINELSLFLEVKPENVNNILEQANKTKTITKSKNTSDWKVYWSDEAEELFNSFGGFSLNKLLGYES